MAENADVPFKFRTHRRFGFFSTNSFVCGWNPFTKPSVLKLGKWKLGQTRSNIPWDNPQAIQKALPVLDYDFRKVQNPPKDKIQITWIGHATVLVQIEGMNILADPVFSEKCGPAGFGIKLGNKRFTPPACQVEDLPPIDVVIISHNHHDHLDSQSVRDIARLHPKARWLVGLGNKKFCVDKGCENVEEMEWWESKSIGFLTFVCTPTQHWCQRYPLDFNNALWCGWVVESPIYKYYFAGDTGYYKQLFQLIGQKYGPFDLASIPIGAYEPRYITEFESVNPEEAVEVHSDIKSKVSIGINWGTFELTNEYYLEPPQELETQMYKKKLDLKTFFNLRIGETWIVGEDRDYDPPFMEREKKETQRLIDGPPTQRHGDDPPPQKHGDDPSTQRHGDDPPTQRLSDNPPTRRHGDDPPTRRHGDDPPTRRHGDDPPTRRHDHDPSTQRLSDDPPTQRHGDNPPTQRHDDDPPTQRHGDDPPTQRIGDGPPTRRHGDEPPSQRHGDDPPTQRHGDDPPTQRLNDDPPTQRHGDDPLTQRLNDGPWKLGAAVSNQHVRKGEKVEASGKLTNDAVGEDQDDDPPLKDTDTSITLSLNNGPGELGGAGSNRHVRKDEKVEASGVLTSAAVGEDQDDDLPFMERGITGTLSLNNGRLDGGLGGYIWKPAMSECKNYHLHRIDPFCQDIKMESRGKQTERSNPRKITPDQPWPHNNQEDSVTGIKPTGRSAPRCIALDAPSTHTNYEDFITGMKPTGHSTPRRMSLDAPWTHNNQKDYVSGIKPTGRSKPRSMAFGAPWTPNNREDSVTGMKPTGRSKPRSSLSQDASSQHKNQDSASLIKPTGRSARD